jgi:hypothetical protein
LKLKEIGLQLCTCTWIEIMTGAGVVLYLILAMNDYILAGLAIALFSPLIVFHFVITWISKRNGLVRIEEMKRTNESYGEQKMSMRPSEYS